MSDCDKIPTIKQLQDVATNVNILNEVVTSKTDVTPTTATDGEQKKTLDALQQEYQAAIQAAGGVPLGEWAAGVTYNAYNEYLVFNGVPYKPASTTQLPYTTQGGDPTAAPDVGLVVPFVELNTLQSLARSLNVKDTEVIYSTNTTTLEHVKFIYDESTQKTFSKPSGISEGEVLVSVSPEGVLVTNEGSYKLTGVNRAGVVFKTLSDVDRGMSVGGYVSLIVGDSVVVQDYAEGNNSGTLFFRVVPAGTGVADGGKYIDLPLTGLQLVQNLKHPVDPKAFGARGMGDTDDTSAIVESMKNGHTVFFQDGTYNHSGLQISNNTLIGGHGAVLMFTGTSGSGLLMGNKSEVCGLRIRSETPQVLVEVDASSKTKIMNCDISGGLNNILVTFSTYGLIIINNTLTYADEDNIFIRQSKRSIISDNSILGAGGWGVRSEGSLGDSPDQNHGVLISDNQIFGNKKGGIRVVGASDNRSQHYMLCDNHIDHNYDDNDLSTDTWGVYLAYIDKPKLHNNMIRAHTKQGAELYRVSSPIVTGNTFWKSTVNPANPNVAFSCDSTVVGEWSGNYHEDAVNGVENWGVFTRRTTRTDRLIARGDIYNKTHRQQAGNGANEGNLFVNHNFSDINNRRCEWSNLGRADFTFKVVGNMEATGGFTPFTGKHFFWSETPLEEGYAVDLVRVFDGNCQGEPQGEVVKTLRKCSKICAGVVENCQPLSEIDYINGETGYLVSVAAVGDNRTALLNGFRVNSENGLVKPGDTLVTSSTPGELMKATGQEDESVVRFKCMSEPKNDRCYGYFK